MGGGGGGGGMGMSGSSMYTEASDYSVAGSQFGGGGGGQGFGASGASGLSMGGAAVPAAGFSASSTPAPDARVSTQVRRWERGRALDRWHIRHGWW